MAPQVKTWVTFNDPGLTSLAGYGYGSFPPGNVGVGSLGVDVYQGRDSIQSQKVS